VLLLRAQVDSDSGSGKFWVPLPAAHGPFFVRLGVYDDHGTRLTYQDTSSFS
jgi:hypothetical protein